MSNLTDRSYLVTSQYANSSSLNARGRIHQFGTNKQGWISWIFEQLELPIDCRVLELGCGNGALWLQNIDRIGKGWKLTLTDLSPGMLDEARHNLAGTPFNFEFRMVDAQQIPFPDASFDAVIANHMLYHVPEPDQALSEICRILRPDGTLHASTIGRVNMIELMNLAQKYAPISALADWDPAEHFGLETGTERLQRFFNDVTVRMYDDTLVVPEAKPIVDYILSIHSADDSPDQEQIQSLTQAVESEIARTGPIRITKQVGMLIARGPDQAIPIVGR